jgi:hypothetical protein
VPKMLYFWTILTRGRGPGSAMCAGSPVRNSLRDAVSGWRSRKRCAVVELCSWRPEILPETRDDGSTDGLANIDRFHMPRRGWLIEMQTTSPGRNIDLHQLSLTVFATPIPCKGAKYWVREEGSPTSSVRVSFSVDLRALRSWKLVLDLFRVHPTEPRSATLTSCDRDKVSHKPIISTNNSITKPRYVALEQQFG